MCLEGDILSTYIPKPDSLSTFNNQAAMMLIWREVSKVAYLYLIFLYKHIHMEKSLEE